LHTIFYIGLYKYFNGELNKNSIKYNFSLFLKKKIKKQGLKLKKKTSISFFIVQEPQETLVWFLKFYYFTYLILVVLRFMFGS